MKVVALIRWELPIARQPVGRTVQPFWPEVAYVPQIAILVNTESYSRMTKAAVGGLLCCCRQCRQWRLLSPRVPADVGPQPACCLTLSLTFAAAERIHVTI